MSKPDIALIYEESLPEDLFQDFEEGLNNEKIKVQSSLDLQVGPAITMRYKSEAKLRDSNLAKSP